MARASKSDSNKKGTKTTSKRVSAKKPAKRTTRKAPAKKPPTKREKEAAKKKEALATKRKKAAMVEALEQTLGVVTTACNSAGIARDTHYRWMKEDKTYAEEVAALEDVALDFAESKLHRQIRDHNTAATIFYLKTKGKKRGYVEKQEIDHTSGGEKIGGAVYKLPNGEEIEL